VLKFRFDALINALSGLGVLGRDKATATNVGAVRELTDPELEGLYRGNWFARRIVEGPPGDCVRRGFRVTVGEVGNLEEGEPFAAALDDLDLATHLAGAHRWSRLFGGGAVVLGIDDGRDAAMEVDEANITAVRVLGVYSRVELSPGDTETDPSRPWYGLPVWYDVTPLSGYETMRVHASRVLRFDGEPCTPLRRIQRQGWGDCVLQSAWDAIAGYGSCTQGAAHIVHEYEVPVMKVKGLRDLAMSPGGSEKLAQRMTAFSLGKGMAKLAVIDAEGEDFTRSTANVSGLADLWDRFALDLSAAARMPVSKLFGTPPRGLSSDDESGARWYYDEVAAMQAERYRTPIRYVCRLLALAGVVDVDPDDSIDVEFAALDEPSELERADVRLKDAQADKIHFEIGAIDGEDVRTSAYGGARYSSTRSVDTDSPAGGGMNDGDPDA